MVFLVEKLFEIVI